VGRILIRRVCVSVIAVIAMAGPVTPQGYDEEAGRRAELELIAATVWQAVVGHDAEALLRYASPFEDLSVTRAQLTTVNSGLACALWSTACLQSHLPDDARLIRTAAIDFFSKHPNPRLRIAFAGIPGALGMESRLDLALVTWVIAGSDADRKFPAHDLGHWGIDHINMCMIHGKASGWRFHSDVAVFFCAGTLLLQPDTR